MRSARKRERDMQRRANRSEVYFAAACLPTWYREEKRGLRELSGARWLERYTWRAHQQQNVSNAVGAGRASARNDEGTSGRMVNGTVREGDSAGEKEQSSSGSHSKM